VWNSNKDVAKMVKLLKECLESIPISNKWFIVSQFYIKMECALLHAYPGYFVLVNVIIECSSIHFVGSCIQKFYQLITLKQFDYAGLSVGARTPDQRPAPAETVR
jgi:hypothetical protein